MSTLAIRQSHEKGSLNRIRQIARPAPGSLREMLEEGAFLVTHPITYLRLARVRGRRREELRALHRTAAILEEILAGHNVRGLVSVRLKRVCSLYRKMRRRDLPPEAIHDLRGLRVIVAGEATCYRVLNLVHRSFEPVLGQFDDYIASPKRNGYQSLHTVVRDLSGRTYEIQIRSSLMHRVAEQGSAAHRRYKVLSTNNSRMP